MARPPTNLLHVIRRLAGDCRGDARSDAELLAAFAHAKDERAFTALVARHGRLVWARCVNVLGKAGESQVDDCFQAVFIALARKAHAVAGASLPSWLAETARRTALEAQRRDARRQVRQREMANRLERPISAEGQAGFDRETLGALYEELDRLPEKLRTPVFLFYLEGRTQAQVAAFLGCDQSVVSRRLSKALNLLRHRLECRGMAVVSTTLAAWLGYLTTTEASLLPRTGVIDSAARAAVAAVSGAKGGASPAAVALATAVLRPKISVWWLVVGGLFTLGGTGLAFLPGNPIPHAAVSFPVPQSWVPERRAEEAAPARTDLHGDPLPPGALMRLGSLRGRHALGARTLSFARDGKRLLLAGGIDFPRLCDVATRRLIREFDQIPKAQFTDDDLFPIFGAVLSPDERLLAVRSGLMGSVYLLDAATGRRLRELPCVKRVKWGYSCVFTPDSKAIAAQIDDRLELRDVATGRTLWQAKDPGIRALACSPDGKFLASVRNKGGFRLWDAHNGKLLRESVSEWQTERIAFSPDGRTLVGSCYRMINAKEAKWSVRFWDVLSAYERGSLGESEKYLFFSAFSPDGKMLATSGEEGICLRETSTGRELRRCPNTRQIGWAAAFSPDGELLAAMDEPVVRFWETATGQELPARLPTGHEKVVTSAAFAQDGRTLISAGADQMVRWWDTRTGRQQLSLPTAEQPLRNCGGSWAVLSPDATRLAVSFAAPPEGETVHEPSKFRTGVSIRDAATGEELSCLDCGNRLPNNLVFSPDGGWLAYEYWIDGEKPAEVGFWDTTTGKRLDHEFSGICPMFSPDGSILALLEPGRAFHFWETATGNKIDVLLLREPMRQMILSPDGRLLAAVGDKGMLALYPWSWDKTTGGRLGPPLRIVHPSQYVAALAFSPDGHMLATAGGIQDGSTVSIWETANGKERARFAGHCGYVTSLAFSSDGRRLASGSTDTTILIWDVAGPAEGAGHARHRRP